MRSSSPEINQCRHSKNQIYSRLVVIRCLFIRPCLNTHLELLLFNLDTASSSLSTSIYVTSTAKKECIPVITGTRWKFPLVLIERDLASSPSFRCRFKKIHNRHSSVCQMQTGIGWQSRQASDFYAITS